MDNSLLVVERNDICTDFIQLISGSNNPYSSAYTESAKAVNDNDTALRYLKNFIASIENVASKKGAVDKRICDSNGNVKDFVGYDNIEKSLKFLATHKTPTGNMITSDLNTLRDMLEKYQPYYSSGYNKKNSLLMREYECALYLLVTGLSMALGFCFDVTDVAGTTKAVPKAKAYFGVTGKKLHEMAEELKKKDHATYLAELDKLSGTAASDNLSESVLITEGWMNVVSSTINMIGALWGAGRSVLHLGVNVVKTMKRTIFGIVPLIRGVIYLSYKRKADTILSLEQNILFIERNIDILNNKQGMDASKKEEIIKKQRAKIEAYRKKAEKLRAQLEEGEKEAATAINAEDTKMKTPAGGDDDFVLESTNSLYNMITEKVEGSSKKEATMPSHVKEKYDEYDPIKKKFDIDVPASIRLGFALRGNVLYRHGRDDTTVDIIFPGSMEATSNELIEDIKNSTDQESQKLIPLIAIARIGNGDFEVICKDNKVHYYSHDSKTRLKPSDYSDPEDIYFVDHPHVKYSKEKKKCIYVGPEDGK